MMNRDLYQERRKALEQIVKKLKHSVNVKFDDGSLELIQGPHKIELTSGIGNQVLTITESEFWNERGLHENSVRIKIENAIKKL